MSDDAPVVLCVDDNEVNLKMLEHCLVNDYRVITASTGAQCLEIVKDTLPDLILLDIIMPEMDGYAVCSQLQQDKRTAGIPVVFVTSLDEEQDRARAFAVGAADYLVKPVQRQKLLEQVSGFLKKGLQWARVMEESASWFERIQPREYIQFKEYVFQREDLDSQARFVLSNAKPGDLYIVAEEVGISEVVMANHIAGFLDLPYIPGIESDDIRIGVLPTTFCRHNHVVPVDGDDDSGTFVLSNPFDWHLMDTLMDNFGLQKRSSLSITTPGVFRSLFRVESEDKNKLAGNRPAPAKKPGTSTSAEIQQQPVEHITTSILQSAVRERASDIHIEPKENEALVRFRIDGELKNMFSLKCVTGVKVISRFKILGGLDIAEKRKPQDGGFVAELEDRTFNLRLSTTSTPYGESLVMRLLEPYATPKALNELGMAEDQKETMIRLAAKSSGIILIVGATGSGKTTTIYSLLHTVDYVRRSVLSVEDPVEYRMPFVNQQQVNEKAGVTFDALLKTAVRQDPDVLFMGEVRDGFSAKVAMDFASTGHLTITTMHTSNATTAIFRIERLGVDRGTMADTVLAVVAQKLVKKLCPRCRIIEPISEQERKWLAPFTREIPEKVAHPGKGCGKCGQTGYHGREGVYEILEFDLDIAEMVRGGEPISHIRAYARRRGDLLISSHAVMKVGQYVFSPRDVFENVLVEEMTGREAAGIERPVVAEKLPDEDVVPAVKPAESVPVDVSVLVVEDDQDSRKLISRYLEKAGYNVKAAVDGVDALMLLGAGEFDLILSDINMPNLDGFKLLEMVNMKRIPAPVVFLTARDAMADQRRGRELGAVDYITKPIRKNDFLERIHKLLQRRKQ